MLLDYTSINIQIFEYNTEFFIDQPLLLITIQESEYFVIQKKQNATILKIKHLHFYRYYFKSIIIYHATSKLLLSLNVSDIHIID